VAGRLSLKRLSGVCEAGGGQVGFVDDALMAVGAAFYAVLIAFVIGRHLPGHNEVAPANRFMARRRVIAHAGADAELVSGHRSLVRSKWAGIGTPQPVSGSDRHEAGDPGYQTPRYLLSVPEVAVEPSRPAEWRPAVAKFAGSVPCFPAKAAYFVRLGNPC
jgi:hypothetical protein